MSQGNKTSSVVSRRYAGALIDLAESAQKTDKVAQDLRDLAAMMAGSADLQVLVSSQMISRNDSQKALLALAEKAGFQDITQNFLGVLIQNGRLSALMDIVESFGSEMSTRRGEIAVGVEVAQDLSASQKKALQGALSKAIGADVSMQLRVVPDILGGMIVTVGSRMIDDSVRRKLEKLKVSMGLGKVA